MLEQTLFDRISTAQIELRNVCKQCVPFDYYFTNVVRSDSASEMLTKCNWLISKLKDVLPKVEKAYNALADLDKK